MTVSVDLRLDFIHAEYARRAVATATSVRAGRCWSVVGRGGASASGCCRIAGVNLDLWK